MNIEQFLKNSLNIQKEADAAADALETLASRGNTGTLMEEYAQDLTHIEQTSKTLRQMIRTLPKDDMQRIFAARYIYKMTWEETADAAFLSVAHVQRVHKAGVAWLEENY